jgi:serine/threonine-protein kinase
MTSLVHSRKEVTTPNVVGKSLYDALEELSKDDLGLKKDGEESSQNLPTGTILRQNPYAGMKVREGKIIKVILSQGGETTYVPDLTGKTIRSADIALKYASLVMGEIYRKFSAVVEKDIIISQDIIAGSRVCKNSVVNIVVSDGFSQEGVVFMPNFIKKNIDEVKIWAARYGIAVNIDTEDVSNIKTNTIIRQNPECGADITNAKSINITVAVNTVSLE